VSSFTKPIKKAPAGKNKNKKAFLGWKKTQTTSQKHPQNKSQKLPHRITKRPTNQQKIDLPTPRKISANHPSLQALAINHMNPILKVF
jgi:hypothetical protein